MAKYRIAINYGGGKVEKDFTIPNETGVYTIAFELEDGKIFAYEVEVGDTPNTYGITGVLTNGTPFSAGTFTTPYLIQQSVSHIGGAGTGVFLCAISNSGQYNCTAMAPRVRFSIYDYISADVELDELLFRGVDLLKGSWQNSSSVQLYGAPSSVSYDASTGYVTVFRYGYTVQSDTDISQTPYKFNDITVQLTAKYYG